MQIGIIQFPGSNCERETKLAVIRAGMEPVEFLWNESHDKLRKLQGYVIVGGFSYEDRSRAGIIAALDPVMQEIKAQSLLGKPVLGICNGAQILVESGLVPGLENHKLAMALTENKRIANGKVLGTGFYNQWVNIRLSEHFQRNAFTRQLNSTSILRMPVAHAEGRFVLSNALLEEVIAQGLHVFQYCDANGVIDEHFPTNPNGSVLNIAAISNKQGNVMAIMPHPERTPIGDPLFHSMRDYITEGRVTETPSLYYYPRREKITRYKKPIDAQECIVELMITDNQALTVQNTLHQLGIPVTVRRQVHWEIHTASQQTLAQIKKSGVLFNDRKEIEIAPSTENQTKAVKLLVRAKEDMLGLQKQQTLANHFNVSDLPLIKHGVLWHFSGDVTALDALQEHILSTNIIINPYAHDYYQYD